MTITTYTLGTNTKQFALSGETSSTGLINAVDSFLVAQGWTQYDTVSDIGITTYVYRILNLDAASYKYLILRWNTIECRLYTGSCESWDTVTDTPTNETFNYRNTYYQGYQLDATDFVVFAHARYALFMSFIRDEPSIWCGVVEFEREAPEDTVTLGVPCFGWVTGGRLASTNNHMVTTGGSSNTTDFVCTPRTKVGYTGEFAACYQSINTPWGTFPMYDFMTSTLATHSNGLVEAIYYGLGSTYAWDTNKKPIHPMRLLQGDGGYTPQFSHGRIMGLKCIPPIGETMNKVSIPVDSNLHFSPGGTATDHWILPSQGKSIYGNSGTGMFSYASNNLSLYSITLTGVSSSYSVACTGLSYYIATDAGVKKVDAGTYAQSFVTGTSGTHHQIIYDGSRYLYTATSTGVTQIDTRNSDAVANLALGLGVSALCTDGTNLMCGNRTTSTTPTFYQVAVPALTLTRTITSPVVTSSAAYITSIVTDHKGAFYALNYSPTAADCRLYKILSNGSLFFVSSLQLASAQAAVLTYDGTELYEIKHASGGQPSWARYTPSTLTYVTSGTLGGNATSSLIAYNILRLHGMFLFGTASASTHTAITYKPGTQGFSYTTITSGFAGTSGGEHNTTDGVRLVELAGSALRLITGFGSRYKAGLAVGQFLLPV